MLRNRTHTATLGVPKPPPFEPSAAAKRFSSLKIGGLPPPPPAEAAEPWEVRPGGMLVQKRDTGSDAAAIPPLLPIRVRVKYGAVYHEIRINPEASFGELKKMLSAETGLHPQDMKLLFKDKERDGNAFLDTCGVKDRSKVVLMEDPTGKAKRFLEMRKNAKMEKAVKAINQISVEVDKLAGQVTQLEGIISKGKKVAETEVLNLIEQLMNILIKLDGMVADGDVKMQRRVQVRRVQKYVETLDVLKIKNSMYNDNVQHQLQTQQQKQYQFPSSQQQTMQQKPPQPPVVVTKIWEPFDLLSSMPPASSTSSATATASFPAVAATPALVAPPRFNWELF